MNTQQNYLDDSMYNIIQTGLDRGFTITQIKKKFKAQLDYISNRTSNKSSKRTKKKQNVKAVRVPLWISDSSDNE